VRTFRALLAVSVVVLLAGTACSGGAGSSSPAASSDKTTAGDRLGFVARDLTGAEFRGDSLRGRDAVLWFWAPWCTVCRGEAPDVVAAAETSKVTVVGVAGRGGTGEMAEFVADTGTAGFTHVVDSDGTIWADFGVFAQPAYAFVDDSGAVEVFVGAMGERALTDKMAALAAR
jgi:thiol-disulfide isomerase/thioredoxin